jgi:hypothetical protein
VAFFFSFVEWAFLGKIEWVTDTGKIPDWAARPGALVVVVVVRFFR